jgi:hypothetical protein
MDPEMENMPTDYAAGLDFTVKKTSKGGYADYSTSSWSRKETALTAAEAGAIEQFGLFNLADFLPKKPTDVELKVIKEMFEASVDGQAYDPDRWSQYYKPAGFRGGEGSTGDEPAARPALVASKPVASVPIDDTPPFEVNEAEVPAATAPVEAKPSSQRAEDILAMIRSRQKTS